MSVDVSRDEGHAPSHSVRISAPCPAPTPAATSPTRWRTFSRTSGLNERAVPCIMIESAMTLKVEPQPHSVELSEFSIFPTVTTADSIGAIDLLQQHSHKQPDLITKLLTLEITRACVSNWTVLTLAGRSPRRENLSCNQRSVLSESLRKFSESSTLRRRFAGRSLPCSPPTGHRQSRVAFHRARLCPGQ